jgi:N-acetyl-anhydromuramyl-L-alanine amidase AmpD
MTAQLRPNRMTVTDRFPMLGFSIRADKYPRVAEVVLATDPVLFTKKEGRTSSNFYTSREHGLLSISAGEVVFMVPTEVLARFVGANRLWFGLATATPPANNDWAVEILPQTNSPYISLAGLSDRALRRVRMFPVRGSAGAKGPLLDWTGDRAQPGTTSVQAPTAPGAASVAPKWPTPQIAAQPDTPRGNIHYDDGFGPLPPLHPAPPTPPVVGASPAPAPATPAAQGMAYGLSSDPEDYGIDAPPYSDDNSFAEAPATANTLALGACENSLVTRTAASPNFKEGRGGTAIDRIIIHITDAPTLESTVRYFTSSASKVSAHYLVGQAGEVVQFVSEADTAKHCKGSNPRSIGIEHVAIKRGGVDYPRRDGTMQHFDALAPSQMQYETSAALVASLCDKYSLPINRTTIMGHREADTSTGHTSCPDGNWDWDYFMRLVNSRTCQPKAAGLGVPITTGMLGRLRRSFSLGVTADSSQAEQSQTVLEHIARSMQQAERTRFNQVHYNSNVVNFGIGSWTRARIATVLDEYETFATEQGSTSTLYGYFGGKSGFNDLRSRFRSNSVPAPMAAVDKSALESLGGDTSLQDAQVRLLAKEVRKYVDAIATDNKYPFIDGYMNAVSEVAAHVLAHAMHQSGQVNDLIAEVIANHGGNAAFGQGIANGTMDEHKFLGEIGEAVTRRVQASSQTGVRRRYQDLITQFEGSGLGYFFDLQPAAAANTLAGGGGRATSQSLGHKDSAHTMASDDWTINWNDVQMTPQPTDMSCWATAAAMVTGWRNNQSVDPSLLARYNDMGSSLTGGLSPANKRAFADGVGLVVHPNACYTPDGFREILEANGPIWVTADVPGIHAILVTGMYRQNGQYYVRITDPWDRVVGTPGAQGSYLSTHNTGSRYIMGWDAFTREFEAAGDIDRIQLLHSGGTFGHTINRGSAAGVGYALGTEPPTAGGEFGYGVSLTRRTVSGGGRSYDLAQLAGLVQPANTLAGGSGQPRMAGQRITLDDWPYIDGPSGRTSAPVTIDWSWQGGAVGDVAIAPGNGQAFDGWAAQVRADISRSPGTPEQARLKLRITTTFRQAGVEDQVAVTEVALHGNGKFQTTHGADNIPSPPTGNARKAAERELQPA